MEIVILLTAEMCHLKKKEYDIQSIRVSRNISFFEAPTRLPSNANQFSPDASLASASLITYTNWQTKTNLCSTHLPILISLRMDPTIIPIPHRTSFNLKNSNWNRYCKEIEDKLSKRRLPTNCQKGQKILRTIILKAASTIYHLVDTVSIQSQAQQRYWKR